MSETKTTIKALNDYFNQGDGKRSLKAFADEVKQLNDAEKEELAQGACDVMGWIYKPGK